VALAFYSATHDSLPIMNRYETFISTKEETMKLRKRL